MKKNLLPLPLIVLLLSLEMMVQVQGMPNYTANAEDNALICGSCTTRQGAGTNGNVASYPPIWIL